MSEEDRLMAIEADILQIIGNVLGISSERLQHFSVDTALLDSLPEMDSMSVVGILSALETQFGIVIEDEEIDIEIFASIGSLVMFVVGKLHITSH